MLKRKPAPSPPELKALVRVSLEMNYFVALDFVLPVKRVKKNPVQIKVGFLMLMAVMIISAVGYISYRNISSIVSSIHVDAEPDLRVLTVREISMELEKAENSIRLYTITTDSNDLRPYLRVIWHINEKTQKLRKDCEGDTLLLQQTDTITRLIRQNINIWQELLALTNSDKLSTDLKHLSDSLNVASANALKPEKGIFNKTFNRKYKSPINEVELINNLNKLEQQDRLTRVKLMEREAELAITSSQIREKLYDIISKMENEEKERINRKADEANDLAEITYQWLALFALSGALLAIIVMFVIVRYSKRAHSYQQALEKSKDEAETLARTKELFMANMSHEIRTPVTAISGFTEQLLYREHDEHTARILGIIKSSSDHLADIINDVLDFSKLQNDKLILEKVNFSLRKVLEDVFALFERQALRNNSSLSFSFSPDTPDILLGDPYRLKQILINLVSNAVKFTANGKVHYSVRSIEKNPQELELVLEVIDTGIGIDEDKIDTIFDDFTQAEMSTTRKYGGTGLGLSIVKKLVELHKGTIVCRSRRNVGTNMTCNLPFTRGDENSVKSEVTPVPVIPDELKDLKVLIVDDEEYNRLLFKTILNRWNLSFDEASNGSEAVDKVRANRYDLVFMDARMPGMDGLKATRIIRDELKLSGTELPVICISAASMKDDWDMYGQAGMNSFLEKPFTEEMLITTILTVLRNLPADSRQTAGPDQPEAPVQQEKINLKNLFHLAGGDEQFVRQMLITFIETTSKGLEDMKEALARGDHPGVAEVAHRLLPPSRHIGASRLTELLKKIEDDIRKNDRFSETGSDIDYSVEEFGLIRELINEEIAKFK